MTPIDSRPTHTLRRLTLGLAASTLVIFSSVSFSETTREWGERALNIQASIDQDAPLNESTWAGTHNSFSNADDDNLLADFTNQSMGIKKQLQSGIRQMVFDVHYDDDAPRVCHNNTSIGECMDGITGNRKLQNAIEDLVEWINDGNTDQVILLKLEMAKSGKNNINKVRKKLDNFDNYYYWPAMLNDTSFPDQNSSGCKDIPSTLTKAKVIASGKNIVLYSDTCFSNSGFSSRVFRQGDFTDFNTPEKTANASNTLIKRVKDGVTKGGLFYESGLLGGTKAKLKPSTVEAYWNAGLNIFETYGFGANGSAWKVDGEYPIAAEDLVWTWDLTSQQPSFSTPNGHAAILSLTTDRYHTQSPSQAFYPACRKLVNSNGQRVFSEWMLAPEKVSFSDAEQACLDASDGEYYFAVPRNKLELNALIQYRNQYEPSAHIWLNYAKSGGRWVADIGEADSDMQSMCENGATSNVCQSLTTFLKYTDQSTSF